MTTLGPTNTTVEYLLDKIQAKNQNKVKAKKTEVKAIGEETGFMCCIFQINIQWEDTTDLPKSIVVKIPHIGKGDKHFDKLDFGDNEEAKMMQQQMLDPANMANFQSQGHRTEIEVYEFLGPQPPLFVPQIYYCQEVAEGTDGIIAMEDFVGSTALANMPDGMSLDQVLAIAEQLAHLHAYCLNQIPGWEVKFMNEEFLKMVDGWLMYLRHVASTLKNRRPSFGDLLPKIDHLFSKNSFMASSMGHLSLGIPSVLVHGDLWANNILWAADQSGAPTDDIKAIIDWQMVHPGNIMEDLARILATSVPHQLRRDKLGHVLEHYHKCLCDKLGKTPFSLEMVHKAYKAIVPHTVLGIGFGVPLWLNIPDVVGEGETKARRVDEMLDRTQAFMEDYLEEQSE